MRDEDNDCIEASSEGYVVNSMREDRDAQRRDGRRPEGDLVTPSEGAAREH